MPTMGHLDISVIAPRIRGPRGADRGFIAGRSGSGKSFLAEELLTVYGIEENVPSQFRGQVFIIDPNGLFEYPTNAVYTSPQEVEFRKDESAYMYRPEPRFNDAEDWNEVWRRLFFSKFAVITYVDETYAMEQLFGQRRLEGGNFFRAYLTRGRARGKAALLAAQRPVNIPKDIIGQAEYFYIFDLPVEEDRLTVAGTIGRMTAEGSDIRDRESLGRYEFWFRGPDVVRPIRMIVSP